MMYGAQVKCLMGRDDFIIFAHGRVEKRCMR